MWGWLGAAGAGALSGLLGNVGAADEPQVRVQGWPGAIDPQTGLPSDRPPSRSQMVGTALGDAASAQENWLASLVGQAMAPVSLPGAVVQPLQGFGTLGRGGVLPFRIGADAVDPAWSNPQLMVQPGINMAGVRPWSQDDYGYQPGAYDSETGFYGEGENLSQFGFVPHQSDYLLPDQEMGQFWSALDILFGGPDYTPWEPENYEKGGRYFY